MISKKIIWTRSIEDLDQDRLFLSDQLVWCLPSIQRLPIEQPFDLDMLQKPWSAAVLTSRYAAFLIAKRSDLQSLIRGCEIVFCLSHGIADLIAPFAQSCFVSPEVTKGADLLDKILTSLSLNESRSILLIGAKEKAFDMKPALLAKGFKVNELDLYETVLHLICEDGRSLTDVDEKRFSDGRWIVCFASPSAVRSFVQRFARLFHFDSFCDAVVIGSTTAAKARQYFSRVHQVEKPSVYEMYCLALKLISSDYFR